MARVANRRPPGIPQKKKCVSRLASCHSRASPDLAQKLVAVPLSPRSPLLASWKVAHVRFVNRHQRIGEAGTMLFSCERINFLYTNTYHDSRYHSTGRIHLRATIVSCHSRAAKSLSKSQWPLQRSVRDKVCIPGIHHKMFTQPLEMRFHFLLKI